MLEQMEAIQEAIQLIKRIRMQIADGAFCVWQKLDHAERYLNKEMSRMLAEHE